MRIITCAGYYCTGSSAVTDLFSEFSNCSSVGNYEFRFIHDPDGIRDLEYNIVENNNRQNTNNAIKRYLKLAKILNGGLIRKGYKRYMEDSFMKYTLEYINEISELKTEAWWHFDQIDRGPIFNFIDVAYSKVCCKFNPNGRASLLKIMHEKAYYSAINKEEFYKYTKKYILNIMNSMNKDNSKILMVDQLLPPSNVNSYLNYFDDIRVIVVDRDPRDIFIIENEIYRWGNIPYKNVEEYCIWYEITRRHRKTEKYDNKNVMLLNFEDLVYKYNETVKKLSDFVGLNLNEHVNPKKHFNPDISINGTNLKLKYKKYEKEIKYIEEHLKDYLYDFPQD